MGTRGLLSRLASGERRGDPVRDVLAHIKVLLNTTQGDSMTVPDFGVVDFTDMFHEVPDSLGALQQAIRSTILKFEPRLKNVVVRYVPSDDQLKLHFEIVGRLASDRRKLVRLETLVDPSGHIDVR
ncbi:MAG: type VI secretion system baseplate subunit TssE [Myxococcota bacterium]